MSIIDINSEAAINNLSDEVREKIDSVQNNLGAINHALSVLADPNSPAIKSADPFDLLTFSKEDAQDSLKACVAKL